MFSKNDNHPFNLVTCLSTLETSDALEPSASRSHERGVAKDKGKQRVEVGHCSGENKTAVMPVRKSDGDEAATDKTRS